MSARNAARTSDMDPPGVVPDPPTIGRRAGGFEVPSRPDRCGGRGNLDPWADRGKSLADASRSHEVLGVVVHLGPPHLHRPWEPQCPFPSAALA